MLGGAVAARLGIGGLVERVGRLDAGVSQFRVEGVEEAVLAALEGPGGPLDGFEATTTCPGPAHEQRFGALAIGREAVDLAQGLFDPEGYVGLEVQAFEIAVLDDLMAAPGVPLLESEVAAAFEAGVDLASWRRTSPTTLLTSWRGVHRGGPWSRAGARLYSAGS